MQILQQACTMHTSGVSQAIVLTLLQHWGPEGLDKHIQKVQDFYISKRNFFDTFANLHLKDLCSWTTPSAGMFFWLRVHDCNDTNQLIQQEALQAGVLLLPGSIFSPSGEASPHVRAAFSTASLEDIEEAIKRFGALLRKHKPQKDAQKGN
uniref:Aminotransferase class I/classII domain-containing protein n=1 Tax=Arcella intermedia TaxID=1963864 RepID=A0A6B2LNC4_9EUKA